MNLWSFNSSIALETDFIFGKAETGARVQGRRRCAGGAPGGGGMKRALGAPGSESTSYAAYSCVTFIVARRIQHVKTVTDGNRKKGLAKSIEVGGDLNCGSGWDTALRGETKWARGETGSWKRWDAMIAAMKVLSIWTIRVNISSFSLRIFYSRSL